MAICRLLITLSRMKTTPKNAKPFLFPGLVLLTMFVIAACGGDDSGYGQQQDEKHEADARIATHSKGNAPSIPGGKTIAGITFTPPSHWKDLEASGMRQAQFRLPPVPGDSAEGEVNVYYFGPQSGGGVEANLQRWIGQITLPDGSDPATVAQRSTFTADDMAGHVVSLNGTYKSGGGRPMGGGGENLPGYRLVGVVLEGPQGSLFFKLTGPEATALIMETELMKMVQGARQ
jgi:hypothetical protein